jgi:hypothetical protein
MILDVLLLKDGRINAFDKGKTCRRFIGNFRA